MRNVVIIGSGRSGTSLVAGTLSKAGYFMGHELMPPNSGNPKGIFESFDIEQLNEDILRPIVKAKPRRFRAFFKRRPDTSQFWLSRVKLRCRFSTSQEILDRIKALTSIEPFCFKDPRFSYTLPVWQPLFSEDTGYICVFRHPAITAQSIVTECHNAPYLQNLKFTFNDGLKVWALMYQHILKKHRYSGEWLFIHFEQIFTLEGLERIEKFTGATVDRSFPEAKYNRTSSPESIPTEIQNIYKQLCELAEYSYP